MQSFKCVDGKWVEMSRDEVLESFRAAEAAWKKRCEERGHNCMDYVEHQYDPNSTLGDYYTCGMCGSLLQVG